MKTRIVEPHAKRPLLNLSQKETLTALMTNVLCLRFSLSHNTSHPHHIYYMCCETVQNFVHEAGLDPHHLQPTDHHHPSLLHDAGYPTSVLIPQVRRLLTGVHSSQMPSLFSAKTFKWKDCSLEYLNSIFKSHGFDCELHFREDLCS